jgi:hypothetical protein
MPLKRSHLMAVGGLAAAAVVIFTIMQAVGGPATAAAPPDSLLAVSDSGAGDSLLAITDSASSDSAPAADSTPTAAEAVAVSRPSTPGLDSAATRNRGSIFTVSSGRRSGAGFLADSSGVVLTSSALVTSGTTVEVFLDAGRRVLGRVALVDSAQGLAAVVVPVRHCPGACNPIRLAPDRARIRQGDTVMAVLPPTLLSPGARAKGTLTNTSARGLAASVGVGASGAGAPVFLPDGTVLGVSRGGDGRASGLVPASAARAFLRNALAAGVQPRANAAEFAHATWHHAKCVRNRFWHRWEPGYKRVSRVGNLYGLLDFAGYAHRRCLPDARSCIVARNNKLNKLDLGKKFAGVLRTISDCRR